MLDRTAVCGRQSICNKSAIGSCWCIA